MSVATRWRALTERQRFALLLVVAPSIVAHEYAHVLAARGTGATTSLSWRELGGRFRWEGPGSRTARAIVTVAPTVVALLVATTVALVQVVGLVDVLQVAGALDSTEAIYLAVHVGAFAIPSKSDLRAFRTVLSGT